VNLPNDVELLELDLIFSATSCLLVEDDDGRRQKKDKGR
jgi:hypothetical protein